MLNYYQLSQKNAEIPDWYKRIVVQSNHKKKTLTWSAQAK
jgi:hypothetical protein